MDRLAHGSVGAGRLPESPVPRTDLRSNASTLAVSLEHILSMIDMVEARVFLPVPKQVPDAPKTGAAEEIPPVELSLNRSQDRAITIEQRLGAIIAAL